jgi:hemin uptake protein HemP
MISLYSSVSRVFTGGTKKIMTPSENQDSHGSSLGPGERTPPDKNPGAEPPPVITSDALLAGRSEIHIRHRGEVYRLTLTRAGKLILHK